MSALRRSKVVPKESVAVRRHRPDYQIVLFMGILMLIGLVVLYSISPARVELINANTDSTLDQAHFMQKQLLHLTLGLIVFAGASFIPFTLWKKYASKLLLGGILACLALSLLGLVMSGSGLVLSSGGAVRWFNLGITSFQPAELLKFGTMIYLAVFLGARVRDGSLNSPQKTLMPVGVILAVATLLIIVFQKDMGTGLTLFGMVAAMLFVAGLSRRWIVTGLVALLIAGVMLIVSSPHRLERVLTFVNSSGVSDASSYHIDQAAIALGSGGLLGKGLGQGVQAFGYLPEAVNDSIFAILGETLGFLGVICILLLFGALLYRLLKIIDRTVDLPSRLLVAGVFGLIASHLVINVGAMTGIFPLTGVTLPFLSFGGTSLLFTMLGLGVVFQVSRYTTHQNISNTQEGVSEATVRRRGVGRTRHTSSRRYQ